MSRKSKFKIEYLGIIDDRAYFSCDGIQYVVTVPHGINPINYCAEWAMRHTSGLNIENAGTYQIYVETQVITGAHGEPFETEVITGITPTITKL